MIKIKSHKGLSKRVKRISGNCFKYKKSNKSHLLTKKSPNRKRKLKKNLLINKIHNKKINKLVKF